MGEREWIALIVNIVVVAGAISATIAWVRNRNDARDAKTDAHDREIVDVKSKLRELGTLYHAVDKENNELKIRLQILWDESKHGG